MKLSRSSVFPLCLLLIAALALAGCGQAIVAPESGSLPTPSPALSAATNTYIT